MASLSNNWDNGYPSGGNYWSDHVCTRNPSFGQPYTIDENNTDRYPFQNPDGWLLPHIEGDVDRNGIVNILDVLVIAVAFGTNPGDEKWDPRADLDANNIINILDVLQVAVHFGESL